MHRVKKRSLLVATAVALVTFLAGCFEKGFVTPRAGPAEFKRYRGSAAGLAVDLDGENFGLRASADFIGESIELREVYAELRAVSARYILSGKHRPYVFGGFSSLYFPEPDELNLGVHAGAGIEGDLSDCLGYDVSVSAHYAGKHVTQANVGLRVRLDEDVAGYFGKL